jgi:hypothetical protein
VQDAPKSVIDKTKGDPERYRGDGHAAYRKRYNAPQVHFHSANSQFAPRCRSNPYMGALRKATLRSLLIKTGPGLRWNEHFEGDGETIFRHACKLGLEGIVSKRLGSPYRSGRSPDWLKMKNPEAPAVKREAEEDWGR